MFLIYDIFEYESMYKTDASVRLYGRYIEAIFLLVLLTPVK